MDTKDKQRLRKFIRSLQLIRGRHTELVSVYIPAGYDLNKIINHLQDEQGTASNIKDKTTRGHVIDSLERMIRHLRLFKKNPVFCLVLGLCPFLAVSTSLDNAIGMGAAATFVLF